MRPATIQKFALAAGCLWVCGFLVALAMTEIERLAGIMGPLNNTGVLILDLEASALWASIAAFVGGYPLSRGGRKVTYITLVAANLLILGAWAWYVAPQAQGNLISLLLPLMGPMLLLGVLTAISSIKLASFVATREALRGIFK